MGFSSSRWSLLYSRFGHQAVFPKKKILKIAAFSGVVAIYFLNTETIPYLERTHLVLVPRYLEKKLGEFKIKKMEEEFKGGILPPEHPHMERVRLITNNVIGALPPAKQCEYLNWEVIVIDRPIVKACCYAGKIVIFTGLLDRLESDAEIATVICHEVGHALARHGAEKITRKPWLIFPMLFISIFVGGETALTITDHHIKMRHFIKLELEADYLGLLLMAKAGYDPRVAPIVYDRLSKVMVVSDYCSELPTGAKRAKLMAEAQVMEEAMHLYQERKSGYGIDKFLLA